jgi:hypothetical protein
VAQDQNTGEGLGTEPVVRVSGEFSLLPRHFGDDLKVSKIRLLLDPRFQLVHYLDAYGLEQTAAATAEVVGPLLA